MLNFFQFFCDERRKLFKILRGLEEVAQVQFQSRIILNLQAIDFFKDQWRVRFHPAVYNPGSQAWPIQFNRLLKLLFVLSGAMMGRKVGWIGLYRHIGPRSPGQYHS